MIGRLARVLLAATLLLPASTLGRPRLHIEAPDELSAAARSLEGIAPARLDTVQRLIGLRDPAPPIRVILAPEGSPPTRAVPPWVAGYALSDRGLVVLMPVRALSYPDSTLDELLLHEIAHVLVGRAAGHRQVPRWFNEGLATVAGSSWGIEDRSRLALALVRRGGVPLSELDAMFAGGESRIAGAYALSGALVRETLLRHGTDAGARVLRELARGLPFPDAFEAATGSTLADFERSFWRRYTLWYRWLPILTSSATLWIGVTLLVFWAGRRRRARSAEIERRWDIEERALAVHDEEPVN
ncbi:MAG: hypothetical protein ACRD2Z_01435 [Thermoanaerobaculia bacterium]